MFNEYIPILMLFVFAAILAGSFVVISALLGKPKKTTTDLSPYECGIDQATLPRRPFDIKFFIVALLFLLFDVEVAVLYPWAALFRQFVSEGLGRFALIEGLIFIGVLAIGLVYILRARALEWK